MPCPCASGNCSGDLTCSSKMTPPLCITAPQEAEETDAHCLASPLPAANKPHQMLLEVNKYCSKSKLVDSSYSWQSNVRVLLFIYFLVICTKVMFSFGLHDFCNAYTVVKQGKEGSCFVYDLAVLCLKLSAVLPNRTWSLLYSYLAFMQLTQWMCKWSLLRGK